MVGWHHQLNGHRFGWTPGFGDGQGGPACCGSWGCKESDTEPLNWNWNLTMRGSAAFIYQLWCPAWIICIYLLKYTMFIHASVPVLHADLLAYNSYLTTDKLIFHLQMLAQMLSKGILLWSFYNTQEFISLSTRSLYTIYGASQVAPVVKNYLPMQET